MDGCRSGHAPAVADLRAGHKWYERASSKASSRLVVDDSGITFMDVREGVVIWVCRDVGTIDSG